MVRRAALPPSLRRLMAFSGSERTMASFDLTVKVLNPTTQHTHKLFARSRFLGCCGCSTEYGCGSSPHRSKPVCMSGSPSARESPESCMTRCCRAFKGSYYTFKELVTYFLSAQRKPFKLWTERWMEPNRRLWKDETRSTTYDPRQLRGWWRKSHPLEKNLSRGTEIRMRHSSER